MRANCHKAPESVPKVGNARRAAAPTGTRTELQAKDAFPQQRGNITY